MPVEEIKVKITADKADVDGAFKDIKGTANKVETESKRAATSIGSVISAVVSAAAVSKITSFFSAAISSYNKLDSALGRVESTSKALGQSIEKNKKQVMDLADQGFLSLTESANAFSDALLLGLDPTKAKKFVESLSDIAAVERTMGTLNEAVSSGIAGLRSGSSERVENIGVSVKKLSQEYQINAQKLGQTAAVEKFYQGVLKESNKYRGEAIKTVDTLAGAQTKYNAAVEKTQAAIGKGLEPVMKAFYATATKVINTFESWFSGLDETTKSILILTPLVAAVAAAIAAAIPLIAGLLGSFAWIPAVILALGGLAAAITNVSKAKGPDELAASYQKAKKEILSMGSELDRLNGIHKKTAEQELQSIKLKNELSDRAKALGTTYEALAVNANSYLEVAKKIAALEKAKAKRQVGELGEGLIGGLGDLKRQRDEATKMMSEARQRGDRQAYNDLNLRRAELNVQIKNQEALIEKTRKRFKDMDAEAEDGGKGAPPSAASGGKGTPEFRFIKARDELRELQKEYDAYIRKVGQTSDLGEEATVKLGVEQERVKGQLRQAITEYNEERTIAALEAENVAYQQARANIYELANAEKLSKEEVEKRLQQAREANARRVAQIHAESFARTMQAANESVNGFAQMLKAKDIGSALSGQGSFLSGISKLSPTLSALGPVGQGIGAIGGIVSTLSGLFGKSDEERAREAEAQKRRDEEAKAILELQANYQKNMLALQEAQAKLPFDNLTRQLRLIDIQAQKSRTEGVDEATIESTRLQSRQTAINNVLSKEAGAISDGRLFSGTEATAEGLTSFLNERASQAGAVALFSQYINTLSDPSISVGRAVGTAKNILSLKGKVPSGLMSAVEASLQELVSAGSGVSNQTLTAEQIRGLQSDANTNKGILSDLAKAALRDPSLSTTGRVLNEAPLFVYRANKLISEINADTTTGENLLSVIEQSLQAQLDIEKNTKATAENTTKLVDGKGDAIVDAAAGGLTQNGAFIGGGLLKFLMGKATIDAAGMMLNPSIQNAMLSSQFLDSFNSRMDSNLDKLVSLTEQEVELLKIIAENLVRNDVTPERESLKQQILQIIEEFGSRS